MYLTYNLSFYILNIFRKSNPIFKKKLPIICIIGYSSWILITNNKTNAIGSYVSLRNDIVYIKRNGNKIYYTSIEKALANSYEGDKVFVTPNKEVEVDTNTKKLYEVKIREDCSIPDGVSLCLPYDDETCYVEEFANNTNSNFADSSIDKINNNRKTLVSIAPGVTLTIEEGGELIIGGVFGYYTSGMTGGTNGAYAELLLKENAKIQSFGKLKCYGYIKEDSENNGSSTILYKGTADIPLVIYDFKGGTITTAIYKKVLPFYRFDMPNIQTKLIVYPNSNLIGEYRLHPSAEVRGNLTIMGGNSSNNIFILTSGYAIVKYTGVFKDDELSEKGKQATTTLETRTTTNVEIYGTVSIGSINLTISLSIGSASIDTKELFFPISYNFNVTQVSGILNVDNNVKFLPGSSVIINRGATINVNKNAIFYPAWDDPMQTGSLQYHYPHGLAAAKLTCNGNINISSNGALAADVISTQENASLVNNSNTTSITSTEPKKNSSILLTETMEVTNSLTGNINGTANSFFEKNKYISDSKYQWNTNNSLDSFSITVEKNVNKATILISSSNSLYFECTALVKSFNHNNFEVSNYAYNKIVIINYSVDSILTITLTISINGVNTLCNISKDTDSLILEKKAGIHKHTFDYSTWHSDSTGHYHLSTCCDGTVKSEILSHKVGDTITKYEQDGTNGHYPIKVCYICNNESKQSLETHNYVETDEYMAAEGNESAGHVKKFKCICGAEKYDENILIHDYETDTEWSNDSEQHWHNKTCKICGYIEKIDTANHDWKSPFNKVCTICNYRYTCFAKGTLVTLGNGSQKKVEDLTISDKIMSFDHETGKYVSSNIAALAVHKKEWYSIINLKFEDGSILRLAGQHGLMECSTKKYISFEVDNYLDFIGKEFYKYDSLTKQNKKLKLVDAEITTEYIEIYSVFSSVNGNHVINNMLSMSTFMGIYNIFELNDDLTYDMELKEKDIKKYGIFTYDDLKDKVPYDIYYNFNLKYLKVAIGKGYLTEKELNKYIELLNESFVEIG